MEDAASLAIFLSSPKLGDRSIEARLERWNDFRHARANTVQTMSIHGGKPLEEIIDQIRGSIGYQGPLPENVNLHDKPAQRFFFDYDVKKDAEAYLDREMAGREGLGSEVASWTDPSVRHVTSNL